MYVNLTIHMFIYVCVCHPPRSNFPSLCVRARGKASIAFEDLCTIIDLLCTLKLPYHDTPEGRWSFIHRHNVAPLYDMIAGGFQHRYTLHSKPPELDDPAVRSVMLLYQPAFEKIFLHFSCMFDEVEELGSDAGSDEQQQALEEVGVPLLLRV